MGGLAVDEQCTDGHRSFQLEQFPVGFVNLERNGVILDAGFCLSAKTCALLDGINNLTCYGNLVFWFLAERYADGVADTLGEQGANTYGTLDASVFAFASFGHAEM